MTAQAKKRLVIVVIVFVIVLLLLRKQPTITDTTPTTSDGRTGSGGGSSSSGGGGTPTPTPTPINGFVITGVGQVVTGASPLQSYHTVAQPARVINITATPAGTYNGSVTINGHTEVLTNIEANATGYPAIYFNPLNPAWNITASGTYNISITLNIAGVNYTRTTSTVVTNTDLGIGTGGNGFVITGVGQVVTGASPLQSYHTVAAPARVINIDATPDGFYNGSVTINGHTEPLENLAINPTGYPAVFFNPTHSIWGITAAGTYSISITLNIAGVNYTKTTTTTVTNEDLGITAPPIDGGGSAIASSVRTDLINVVKNVDTGLYSDIAPDVPGFVKYYYINGFPYLNNDGSRKLFVNESLRAGLIMEVSAVFLDPAHYPTYASWIEFGWQTKIKVGDNYPNDGWIYAYAQQNFITA